MVKIDLYTRVILTIIALALLGLLALQAGTTVTAQAKPAGTTVVIAGWQDAKGHIYALPGLADPRITALPFPTRER